MSTAVTKNKRGFTYELPEIGKKFILDSQVGLGPVLDVGAAYGVATLPALRKGLEVVAIDINKEHLNSLEKRVPVTQESRLTTMEVNFPYVNFPDNYFQAIYISQVFPFLKPFEIEMAAEKIFKWLRHGGKLYVVSFTPYLKHCESYIPIYEAKKESGEEWAGYIECLSDYSVDNPIASALPESINHIDQDDLHRVFSPLFDIQQLFVFGDPNNHLPEWIRYDGKERVGMIAKKGI
ncbi:class I SAM-dependent methyltransferase [Fulvivirga sediminis]|uniref:Class I SAM-dependent methyltransferase n=1 Tax=Fulvivirga sediminis TaxID=2803949 RepID=A0A937F4M4_9BACT|nr:class I SAM-dependent methyltransferase [Fulvivirga sediminis]MBL3656312.1 class I SAM-dependent methyltransferase [Fulvivirga sediminis]